MIRGLSRRSSCFFALNFRRDGAAEEGAAGKDASGSADAANRAVAEDPQRARRDHESLPLVYSKWAKFCGTDSNNPQTKPICLTVSEARLETGQFVAGAALIEQAGDEKKLLRVTLPLGLRLTPGVRMFIDGEAPRNGNYEICFANGCMADFEVNPEFVVRLKTGEQLQLQGTNVSGQIASYLLPLGGFGPANEGPPTDPKALEREQRQRDAPPAFPKITLAQTASLASASTRISVRFSPPPSPPTRRRWPSRSSTFISRTPHG